MKRPSNHRSEEQPTMKDVAELAGTSTSTVSRVLSGRGAVSPELQRKVMELVRETGYVPNISASVKAKRRGEKRGALNTVALASAIGQKSSSYRGHCAAMHEGVMTAAEEMGITVVLCLVRDEDAHLARPPATLTRIQADGILAHFCGRAWAQYLPRIAPTVLVGSSPNLPVEAAVVEPDQAKGVWRLVEHLAGLGHKRIEYAPRDLTHNPYCRRGEAFEQAAEHFGLSWTVAPPVGFDVAEYAQALLARPLAERPTAVVASSDGLAVPILHALLAEGASVPDDVSVVGFDGDIAGEHSVPPLTTWRVSWLDMGRTALEVLAKMVNQDAAPSHTLLGGELVVRRSSGQVPDAGEQEEAGLAAANVSE